MEKFKYKDRVQLGQLIRFKGHMLDMATKTVNIDEKTRKSDLEELENDLVRQAFERAGDNQTEAARLLGVTRGKFRTMMKQSKK